MYMRLYRESTGSWITVKMDKSAMENARTIQKMDNVPRDFVLVDKIFLPQDIKDLELLAGL